METEISAKAHFRELILIMDTAKHLAEYFDEYFDLVPTFHDYKCFSS